MYASAQIAPRAKNKMGAAINILRSGRLKSGHFFVLTAPVFAFSQLAGSQVKVRSAAAVVFMNSIEGGKHG